MPACDICGGAGGAYGNYETCYRCGGSGHGSHTNVACMGCGGSGHSNTRQFDTCWKCNGTGQIAGPRKRQQTKQTAKNSSRPQGGGKTKNAGGENIGFWIFVAGTLGGGFYLSDTGSYAEPWHPFAIAAIPSLVGAAFWRVLIWIAVIGGAIALFLAAQQ